MKPYPSESLITLPPPHPPACQKCPAGTEPALGYEYKWWNLLPANMKTSCFNVGNSKCDGMNGEDRCSKGFWGIDGAVGPPMKQ